MRIRLSLAIFLLSIAICAERLPCRTAQIHSISISNAQHNLCQGEKDLSLISPRHSLIPENRQALTWSPSMVSASAALFWYFRIAWPSVQTHSLTNRRLLWGSRYWHGGSKRWAQGYCSLFAVVWNIPQCAEGVAPCLWCCLVGEPLGSGPIEKKWGYWARAHDIGSCYDLCLDVHPQSFMQF